MKQGLQLAEALQYMHNDAMPGKMVIHRDLKPDNIGFDADGNLKLIDLGLGRVREEKRGEIVYRLIVLSSSDQDFSPEAGPQRSMFAQSDQPPNALLNRKTINNILVNVLYERVQQ